MAVQGVSGVVDVPESTYGFTGRDGPSVAEVRVTAVTAHGWRISDERLPKGDPFRVLAFVEHHGDVFEVMQLGAGFEWHEFESMDAAVAFVVETGSQIAQQRFRDELSWAQ